MEYEVKVHVDQALQYAIAGVYDDEVQDLASEAILAGKTYFWIPKTKFEDIELRRKLGMLAKDNWNTLFSHKQIAQGLEKQGKLEEAFLAYKDLVSFAATAHGIKINNYSFDLNRFRIVCNKLKRIPEYEKLTASLGIENPK